PHRCRLRCSTLRRAFLRGHLGGGSLRCCGSLALFSLLSLPLRCLSADTCCLIRCVCRIVIERVRSVVDGIFVLGGHLQTVSRTWNGAEVTITAFRHVDIKAQDKEALRIAGGRFAEIFPWPGPDGVHIDAVHRAYLDAKPAADA